MELDLGGYQGPIKNLLPNSVKHLVLGKRSHPLQKGDIPSSVKYLEFNNTFNEKLNHSIPEGVESIIFGKSSINQSKMKFHHLSNT